MNETNGCEDYRETLRRRQPSRRSMLLASSLSLVGWLASPRTALAQIAVRPAGDAGRDLLVVVFLRGGMDGLSAIVPYREDAYHRNRPNLAIAAPGDRRADAADRAIDLDGSFAFHPSLRALAPLWDSGQLAAVHAVGSGDQTRSHFEAMAVMERGLAAETSGAVGGWLARYLRATARQDDSPFRAIALSSVMPDSLVGATHAINLSNIANYRLEGPPDFRRDLERIYAEEQDAIGRAGQDTLRVLGRLQSLDAAAYRPSGGAVYPDTELGAGLRQVALLAKAGVGLQVACLDRGAWDTHVAQGRGTGWLAGNLADLGDSLAAFARDMGPRMAGTTVVAMTEFGRRIYENSGLGTDHGRASCLFLLGGGVRGGKVYGRWPGLEPDQWEEPGDLRVATDYRDVLAELLEARTEMTSSAEVFAGHESGRLGLFRPLA